MFCVGHKFGHTEVVSVVEQKNSNIALVGGYQNFKIKENENKSLRCLKNALISIVSPGTNNGGLR